MCSNIKTINSRKRPYSALDSEDFSEKNQQCILTNEICSIIQNTNFAKKSIKDEKNIYDYENFSAPITVKSKTENRNYINCLSGEDRRIAIAEYSFLYDIQKFSDNYENSPKGLAVISDYNLDSEIAQFKEIFHDRDVALRTFIINLRDSHWVTLVVSYQNGVFVGYYVDSLYDEDGQGNERNKIQDNIKEILINRAIKVEGLKIHQKPDSHNCGLLALVYAKDINEVLRDTSADENEIFPRFQAPNDFTASWEYLKKKLNRKDKEEEHPAEFFANTSSQHELVTGNNSSFNKEVFAKLYVDDSYPSLNKCVRHSFAKVRGYFNLHGITYQLNLMMLCFYRAFVVHQFKTFSLAAEKVGVGRFDDIVLYHRNEAVCIQIKHIDVERYYNNIGFLELFPLGYRKQRGGMFSINKYFNSFIEMKNISDVKYILIYTNVDLNLTEDLQLKRPKWSRDYFPVNFDVIDMEKSKYKILKDCLCKDGTSEGHGFYKFSCKESTRAKLLNLLVLNNSSTCEAGNLEEMKNVFLNKLIFAVNQPGREELNYIIKHEIGKRYKTNMVPYVFIELQEGMLNYLTNPKGIYITKENAGKFLKLAEESDKIHSIEQDNKYRGEYKKAAGLRNCTPHVMYKLELIMYCLYKMYQRSDRISISAEDENIDLASNICFHYENKITFVWTKYGPGGVINFNMLFPSEGDEDGEMFSLNKYFKEYIKNVQNEIWRVEHLVIYTNMGLDLTEEGKFHGVPIKFNSMDIRKHKVLTHYLCTSNSTREQGFYQFSTDTETRRVLFNLLDSQNFTNEHDKIERLKINFLKTLVFAVNQLDRKKLASVNKIEIQQYNKKDPNGVLLEYIALHEVALRCLSASKIYCITSKTLKEKFKDIKDNKFSAGCARISNEKKDEFARIIVADRGLCHFREFRKFLDSKEGSNMFDVLCKNKAERNVSCMLTPTGIGIISAFKRLYYMLFCKDGNKSDFLKSLINGGLKLSNVSSILHKAGNKAPETLTELSTILKKKLDGTETYLEFFVRKRIIENICSMLSGAGNDAATSIVALYTVLLAKFDNEEALLAFILRKNIMKNISSMLRGAGNEAANALKQLFNVFIMKLDKKETFLEFIFRKNIMKNISSILSGAGRSAPDSLRALISLLITVSHGEISYLEFLIDKNVMTNISSILHGAGQWACESLAALSRVLETKMVGEITYLDFFIEKNIMGNISSMLTGAGKRGPETLEALCTLLTTKFDGEMTYLDVFMENKIMGHISSMLSGAGSKLPEAFGALFTKLNKKFNGEISYLQFFVENKLLGNISSMLYGAGYGAGAAFESLFSFLSTRIDDEKTYLDIFIEKKVMGNISSMLNGAGQGARKALEALCTTLCKKLNGKMTYFDFFMKEKIMGNISSILNGAGKRAPEALEALCAILNTKLDGDITYLNYFVEKNVFRSISSMLHGAGRHAPEVLEAMFTALNTKLYDEVTYLEFFVEKKVFRSISSMLHGAGRGAAVALEAMLRVLSTKLYGKITYLEFFVEKKVFRNISSMLSGTGHGAPEALEALCSILSMKLDSKMTYLEIFVEKKIIGNISNMLKGAGRGSPETLVALYNVLSTKCDDEITYLDFFLKKRIMRHISNMLHGGGRCVPEALKELILFFGTKLNDENTYLDFFLENNVLKHISSMLKSTGRKAPEVLKELHDLLFNKQYLEHFTKEGINLSNLSYILKCTRSRAPSALRRLHSLCFDTQGNKTKYFSELIIANHSRPVLFSLFRKAASI